MAEAGETGEEVLGRHLIADMTGLSPALLRDGNRIMRTLKEALDALTASKKRAPSFDDPLKPGDDPPTEAEILRDAIGDATGAIDALDEALQQLKESLEQLNQLAEGETR